MGHQINPEVTCGCQVPKGWGEEIIIENNELYCGKLLIFKQGTHHEDSDSYRVWKGDSQK